MTKDEVQKILRATMVYHERLYLHGYAWARYGFLPCPTDHPFYAMGEADGSADKEMDWWR